MDQQKLIETVEKMSVLELSELIKALEEKFGVSAVPILSGPMMMGAMPATGDAGEEGEAKTAFSVELTNAGAQKIHVIKVLREITSLGLKEAKDLADAAPKMVKEGVSKEEADEMKKKLEEAGGTVAIK